MVQFLAHFQEVERANNMNLKTPKEIVAGFLLKEWPNKIRWSKSRKEQYLLKEEITEIVSIDESVHESVDLNGSDIDYLPGSYFGQELLEECILHSDYLSLAVSMVDEPYKSLFQFLTENNIYIPSTLFASNNQFILDFLGYEVADFMFVSSLTNCEYKVEEKKYLTSFRDRLNECGLFDDIASAEEYKNISDLRVKEHAPFYVFGLYRVKLKPTHFES